MSKFCYQRKNIPYLEQINHAMPKYGFTTSFNYKMVLQKTA